MRLRWRKEGNDGQDAWRSADLFFNHPLPGDDMKSAARIAILNAVLTLKIEIW
jgi:hypothetical protein